MTQRPFHSEFWYRVSGLRPLLKRHARVIRNRYRGRVAHVVHDHISGHVYRLSPATFTVVSLMNGARTVEEIWLEAGRRIGSDAPSQDEVIQLLSQLSGADLLQTQVAPDASELASREQRTRLRSRLHNVLNPLAMRMRVWDPDGFLERTAPALSWMFGYVGAFVWVLVVSSGIALAAQHWNALSAQASGRIFSADNIFVLVSCYLVLKLIHEFGHAYAVKVRGGDVHEMGVMFLALAPVPYVDASAASAFRHKRDRILVGAAGMIVEVFLAAIALFVWLSVEDGLVRTIAYDVMLIAGISTVLFNINPLLRFDGYYMLSDALEIPNLAQRANTAWATLVDRYVLKPDTPFAFEADATERIWLLAYAPASLVYRIVVLLAIAMVVASEYLAIGVVIAIWALILGLLVPTWRAIATVVSGPRYRSRRARAVVATTFSCVAVAGCVMLVPVPCHTTTEGVVWLPDAAVVRARIDGFVGRLLVEPGRLVNADEPLIESEEPLLTAEAQVRHARVKELEARLAAERFSDRARAEITGHELRLAQAELADLGRRVERLTTRSLVAGTFTVAKPYDLPGRFVREGSELGYVLPSGSRIVRAVVSQEDFELVRNRLRAVRIRLSRHLSEVISGKVVREVPGGTSQLPSKALGQAGGGALPVAASDPQGRKVAARVFQVDLEVAPEHTALASFGSRVYVRFEHDWEPVGHQAWRRLRQLLLSQLGT